MNGPALIIENNVLRYQEDRNLEPLGDAEVQIDILQVGICETDLQLVSGYMNYQGVLGHEFVGVAQSGRYAGKRVVGEINVGCQTCKHCKQYSHAAQVDHHCPNRTVLGILGRDGAFARSCYLPQRNLHCVPDNVSNDQAVFTEPLAAAFQITEQLDMKLFQRAAVLGDGRLGYLCAQVLRRAGLSPVVIGKHPVKLSRFESLGIEGRLVESQPDREFDLLVDCTGNASGVATAVSYLMPRGTLVLKTTITDQHRLWLAPVVIDEFTILGSRCGPFGRALDALASGEIEVDSLVTARRPLSEGIEALKLAGDPLHQKVLLDVAS